MSVDLPAPFGPRMAVCSPTGIVSETAWSARVVPRTTVASCSSTIGSAGAAGELMTPVFRERLSLQPCAPVEHDGERHSAGIARNLVDEDASVPRHGIVGSLGYREDRARCSGLEPGLISDRHRHQLPLAREV